MTHPAVPAAAEVAAALGADGTLVFASDGRELTVVDAFPASPAAARLRVPVGFGVTGTVARSGKPAVLASDVPRGQLYRELLGIGDGGTVSRLVAPTLGLDGELVGVLALNRRSERPFRESDLERVQPYADRLGLGLHARSLWGAAHQHRNERDRLMARAISAQEAERRRIAFDLHDGVTTALASMSFHLSAAEQSLAADVPAHAQVLAAQSLADTAYDATRAAISGLHSLVLGDLGLTAALESLLRSAAGSEVPTLDLMVDPDVDLVDIPDHASAALYRIAQESLRNAVKHSGAERVVVSLRKVGDSILLGCTDDGVGFDVNARRAARAGAEDGAEHFGLTSIAERCALIDASLRVESIPGRGTTLLVELPLAR